MTPAPVAGAAGCWPRWPAASAAAAISSCSTSPPRPPLRASASAAAPSGRPPSPPTGAGSVTAFRPAWPPRAGPRSASSTARPPTASTGSRSPPADRRGTARRGPDVLSWMVAENQIGAVVADEGFTTFFEGAYPRVVGQLRLLTGDLAAAEDAAQEAFVRAASRWRQLSRYDQPEAWVRMTAFRLAVDGLRRAGRQRRLVARLGGRRGPEAELDPGDRAVVEALGRLPLPMREVLVLHHCLDLPVETVATQTGVSVGTVKSRLARGRERLAELLAPAPSPESTQKEERHARP